MIRSFGYAAAARNKGENWTAEKTNELLTSYGDVDKDVLRAYIADKCAYEVVYELENRPHMVDVPARALATLLS